ncbi:hypothetical protein [Sorangium sp. So ce131]|uniref:hypothetical protein n=1 Tax=Sorangium sp. So ce131 TaxID=3133282 RepID=UPI003F62B369
MRGLRACTFLAAPLLAAVALSAPLARADGLGDRPGGTPPPFPRAPPPPRSSPAPRPLPPPGLLPARRSPPPPGGPTRAPDPWLGRDKALHFFASAALAGGGYTLGALATDEIPGRLAVGAAVALGAGLAKEVFDAAGYGTPSWRDLAWDALGTSAGLGLSLWFDLAVLPVQF